MMLRIYLELYTTVYAIAILLAVDSIIIECSKKLYLMIIKTVIVTVKFDLFITQAFDVQQRETFINLLYFTVNASNF